MRKKVIRKMSWLLIIIMGMTSCFAPKPPEETIEKFEKALNAMNIDRMFECFEPNLANQLSASFELGNSISKALTGVEIDAKALLALFPLFSGISLDGGETRLYWPKWDMKDYQVEYGGNNEVAFINCAVDVDMGEGRIEKYEAYFELELMDGEWLICNMR